MQPGVLEKKNGVLKIRTLSAPQNIFNIFVIITQDLIIIFHGNLHKSVESRSIQQINFFRTPN